MYQYPPSYFGLQDIVVQQIVPALILAAAGWFLWRRRRKARAGDLAVWILISFGAITLLSMQGEVFLLSPSATDRQLASWGMSICFFALPLGCIVSLTRIWKQKAGVLMALAIAAAPFLCAAFVLLLPSHFLSHFEGHKRSECRGNLRMIGDALHRERDDPRDFPPTVAGDPPVSWRVRLLPRLDQTDLFGRYDKSVPWDFPPNEWLMHEKVQSYQCPTDKYWSRRGKPDTLGYTSYAAAVGPHAVLSSDAPSKLSGVTDGTSNTIMLLEVCGQKIVWSEPRDIDISQTPLGINLPGNTSGTSPGVLSSQHRSDGAFMATADGAVRFLSQEMAPEILQRLLQRDDGKPVGDF